MPSPDSARSALRHGTSDQHDVVDAIFSQADLDDRVDYGRFLQAQAAAHLAVEAALDRDGAAEVVPDWASRRRGALLRADLAALGLAAPPLASEIRFGSEPKLLGGVYVLEGSRLGGALLARSVPAGFPASFLRAGDSSGWRVLMSLLDDRLASPDDRQMAIKAARDVFVIFERAGREFLRVEQLGG